MSKRTVLGVMLSVLIIGIFGSVLNPNPVLSSEVYSQEKALDFTLTDIYGETFCLYDCSARVVLLEFFGTWCAPCLSQIPALRNIYGNYSRDQLEMISISSESEDVLLDFAEENNVTWVVAYDPGGDVHTAYAVQYIPTIFIIDAQRYIQHKHVGLTEESTLRSEIESLLPKTIYVDDDNTAGPWDGTKGHPYQNITSGLEHVLTGDTIFVYNGTYYENVVVNKTISLIGENVGGAIIDGGGIGTVVTVQTNNVSINRFTIRNSGAEWQGSWWDSAILLNNSDNSILEQNNLINNHCGIWLEGSTNNTISRNYISANSMRGIILINSANNMMVENNVTDNEEGISLHYSFDNSLTNNVMFGNQYNFGIFGETLDHFIQNIDVSNTVNGKPIYYLINQNNLVIDPSTFPNIGYLGLINSTNIMVKELDLRCNVQGALIAYSTNLKIKNNKLTNTVYGISLVDSATNIIAENNITNNVYGVGLRYSLNNTLSGNNITNNVRGVLLIYSANNNTITRNDIVANEFTGIDLTASTYNVIYENNITDNRYGMWVHYSWNNSVYHNNFVDNTVQVDTPNSVNVWDNGYPSGGNYWSDYSGVDVKSGPNQDILGSDGIGDAPYIIDANNTDHYPLMNPWGTGTPVADFTWTPLIPKVGESVTFDASSSTPKGGEIVSYEWSFGDDHYGSGKIVAQTYNGSGTYTVKLNVTDSEDLWNAEEKQIQVVQPHGPKAKFTAIPDTALTGESIKFDASGSSSGWNGTHEMPIVEYRWDFADGNQTTTSTPTVYHSFSSPGIYYVTLTVYAPGATPETDSVTHKITIISIPVGGYSLPIEDYATEKPLTLYLALIAILTTIFTMIKRKTHRRTKHSGRP